MTYRISALALILTLAAPTFAAAGTANVAILPASADKVVFHGGGCRKSSPAGQCCHAGSQPLHCH